MNEVLKMENARVFFNGIFSEPRLNHPEGILVDSHGCIWCGGEEGEIYRIDRDGYNIELMGKTNGFALGLAMDSKGYVYVCDQKFACVFRFDPKSKELIRFADGNSERKMNCPNYAVVDEKRGYLYVSDTQEYGPGVWRYNLKTGEGSLWYDGDCIFANGMSLSEDGNELFLVESFASKVSRIRIDEEGMAAQKDDLVEIPGTIPDGLALDRKGSLYISCYEPSCIYRYNLKTEKLELLLHDRQCVTLAHPTNIAFRGEDELFCASLGRWHISVINITN